MITGIKIWLIVNEAIFAWFLWQASPPPVLSKRPLSEGRRHR